MKRAPDQFLPRRKFLFETGKSLAMLAAANAGTYVIGSVLKAVDGSIVAGAKTCTYYATSGIALSGPCMTMGTPISVPCSGQSACNPSAYENVDHYWGGCRGRAIAPVTCIATP